MKKCTKCLIEQPLENFHVQRRARDGRREICKACRTLSYHNNIDASKAYERKRYANNREEQLARKKEARKQNGDALRAKEKAKRDQWSPEKRVTIAIKSKAWRVNNRERWLATCREYNRTHREEKNAYERQRRKDKPEWEKSKRHTRRARAKAGGKFTPSEWRKLVAFYGGKCLCCRKKPDKLTPDHVVPLCKSGQNTIENIQPLCKQCNIDKGRLIIDHRKRKPGWFRSTINPQSNHEPHRIKGRPAANDVGGGRGGRLGP